MPKVVLENKFLTLGTLVHFKLGCGFAVLGIPCQTEACSAEFFAGWKKTITISRTYTLILAAPTTAAYNTIFPFRWSLRIFIGTDFIIFLVIPV